jgi:DNA-binding transcriptional MocR family regulator
VPPSARVEAGLRERLAAEYGVSLSSVARALHRLADAGLVEIVPAWGTLEGRPGLRGAECSLSELRRVSPSRQQQRRWCPMPLTLRHCLNSRTATVRYEGRHLAGHPEDNGASMGRNDNQPSWSTREAFAQIGNSGQGKP